MTLKSAFIDDKDDIRTVWIVLILAALIGGCVLGAIADAVSADALINVGVAETYASFTVLVPCECEVAVECSQGRITNQTLIDFNWLEDDYKWSCS